MIARRWEARRSDRPFTADAGNINPFSVGQFCASHGAGLKETVEELFSVADPHRRAAHISNVVQERTEWLAAAVDACRKIKMGLNKLLQREDVERELALFSVLYKNMADSLALTLVPDEGIKNEFLEQIKKQEIFKRFAPQEGDITMEAVQKLGAETVHDLDWMKKYLEDKLANTGSKV